MVVTIIGVLLYIVSLLIAAHFGQVLDCWMRGEAEKSDARMGFWITSAIAVIALALLLS